MKWNQRNSTKYVNTSLLINQNLQDALTHRGLPGCLPAWLSQAPAATQHYKGPKQMGLLSRRWSRCLSGMLFYQFGTSMPDSIWEANRLTWSGRWAAMCSDNHAGERSDRWEDREKSLTSGHAATSDRMFTFLPPANTPSASAPPSRCIFWCKRFWKLHLWRTIHPHKWKTGPRSLQSKRRQTVTQTLLVVNTSIRHSGANLSPSQRPGRTAAFCRYSFTSILSHYAIYHRWKCESMNLQM